MTTEIDQTTPENKGEEPVQLTLADLQTVLNVVDLASSRGAFRGDELKTVGENYEKIKKFLTMISEAQKAKEEDGDVEEKSAA